MAFAPHIELYAQESTPELDAEIARLEKEGRDQWEECLDKMIYSFYWISMKDTWHDFPESNAYEKKNEKFSSHTRKNSLALLRDSFWKEAEEKMN
jgi:hypothetical protein